MPYQTMLPQRPHAPIPCEVPLFAPEDLISSYSRAQAIEDGQLVDVSEVAREAGLRYPVALTRACAGETAVIGWPVGGSGNATHAQ